MMHSASHNDIEKMIMDTKKSNRYHDRLRSLLILEREKNRHYYETIEKMRTMNEEDYRKNAIHIQSVKRDIQFIRQQVRMFLNPPDYMKNFIYE